MLYRKAGFVQWAKIQNTAPNTAHPAKAKIQKSWRFDCKNVMRGKMRGSGYGDTIFNNFLSKIGFGNGANLKKFMITVTPAPRAFLSVCWSGEVAYRISEHKLIRLGSRPSTSLSICPELTSHFHIHIRHDFSNKIKVKKKGEWSLLKFQLQPTCKFFLDVN